MSYSDQSSFYVEFGRNKPREDGSLLFIRNEFKQVRESTLEETQRKYIEKYPDWGLYSTAFEYNKPDPYDSDLRGDFFLDFDDEDNIKNAQQDALQAFTFLTTSPKYKIPGNMIRIYFSGKKGIHIIVPRQCFDVEWHPQLDKVYKELAANIAKHTTNGTLDMKVYEKRRMFRIPRSMHASTGAYKVPMELKYLLGETEESIQALGKDQNYGHWIKYEQPILIPEAARMFKECEQKVTERYKKNFNNTDGDLTLDFDPPCYKEMIVNGPMKGTRNHVACMLVAFWRQRGLSEQDAWDNLIEWNNGSLPERELSTLFRSNFKGKYVYGCGQITDFISCPAHCKDDCKFHKEREE